MYNPTRPMSRADIAHDLFEKIGEEVMLAYIETIAPPPKPWEQTDTITFWDASQVSRHLPNRLNPERTPHYHFIGSPHLPKQKERKEPANPSTQQPPTIDNTHLGNPLDTESVIIEILDGAESIAPERSPNTHAVRVVYQPEPPTGLRDIHGNRSTSPPHDQRRVVDSRNTARNSERRRTRNRNDHQKVHRGNSTTRTGSPSWKR